MEKTYLLLSEQIRKTYNSLSLNYNINDSVNHIYDTFQDLINVKKSHINPLESVQDNHQILNDFPPEQSTDTKTPNFFFFNQNKFVDENTGKELSDTQGDLKGVVYFAQSSVIPAIKRIQGDIQPTLVSERKTLVMFKPLQHMNERSEITLRIYDKKNDFLTSLTMRPPSELPMIASNTIKKTLIPPEDFTKPWNFDTHITSQNEKDLNQRIHNAIANNKYIKIVIDDNKNPIQLTSDEKYIETHIEFSNNSKKQIEISYNNNKIKLPKGHSIKFICDKNGHWVTKSDAEIARYYSLNSKPSDAYLLKSTQTSIEKKRLIIDGNIDVNKVSKDVEYFNTLIDKHDVIEIVTSDGNWAKNFTLDTMDAFQGKKVIFTSNAVFYSYISYGHKDYTLTKGESITFEYHLAKKWLPTAGKIPKNHHENLNYMENTWSVVVPKEYIKPDIRLEFNTIRSKGILSNLHVGAPSAVLINTIDIGMLTPPRDDFPFQYKPELNRQYYQTIPTKHLIVTQFEPVHLKEVIMPNGDVFTKKATGYGGGHDGNMREQIAKDLISDGINLANYGVNSSAPRSAVFLPTFQVSMHNSVGVYDNGKQEHGWSGGDGKATLYRSTGNELSHELGHNYGLDHYHGGMEASTHAQANKKYSTWVWDAEHHYFIPNTTETGEFNTDAMAGGKPYNAQYNSYTLYTPSSLVDIQKRLENSFVFSPISKTGYQKWVPEKKEMVDANLDLSRFYFFTYTARNGETLHRKKINTLIEQYKFIHIKSGDYYHSPNIYIPSANHENKHAIIKISSLALYKSKIHINDNVEAINKNETFTYVSDGYKWIKSDRHEITKKPHKQGVPIVTLTGFYDPEGKIKKQSCIPLYGSYGMIYQPDEQMTSGAPFLEVILQNGKKHRYQLNHYRVSKDLMNKFHINIERELNPITANIYVNNKIVHTQQIDINPNRLTTTINGSII